MQSSDTVIPSREKVRGGRVVTRQAGNARGGFEAFQGDLSRSKCFEWSYFKYFVVTQWCRGRALPSLAPEASPRKNGLVPETVRTDGSTRGQS